MRKFFSLTRKPYICIALSIFFFSVVSLIMLCSDSIKGLLPEKNGVPAFIQEVADDYADYMSFSPLKKHSSEIESNFENSELWYQNFELTDSPSEKSENCDYSIYERFAKGASYMDNYGGIYVINEDGKEFDIKNLLSQKPVAFAEKNSSEPQILIFHTHTTEAFNMKDPNGYNKADSFRSDNEAENIVRIGEILTKKLTAAGYNTIHSKTVHDKDFNHSYSSSNREILKYLNQYPSIKIVIDVHRDTLMSDKGTRYKPVVTLNGEKSAQVMLLMAAGNPTYQHPNWHKNFCFALHLQKTANEMFPGLMRPILLRDSRYNQHLSTGGMLAEIGADANSLQEAERAADYFADALITLLNKIPQM